VRTQAITIGISVCFIIGLGGAFARDTQAPSLPTVAEKSNYQATSRHADVSDFCERLAKLSPLVRLGELGKSTEDRKLPLIIIADPPIASAEEALKSKKLVVYAQGNIHAGEVDGKEALLMLARDLVTEKDKPLLKNLIIVLCPIFNADGNERMSKTNRPGQNGPADGMGIRANAQGYDLNRDFVKLESPEVRSLIRFMNKWNPAVVIDCHTTNGSHHRYTITYEGPRMAAGDPSLVEFAEQKLFPEVTKRLEKSTGYKSYYYGNFSRDRKRWETVPATPRYGTLYAGLRNCIGVLSESYSYATYKDRTLATRAFVRTIFEYVAENKKQVEATLEKARDRATSAGKSPQPSDRVAVREKTIPLGGAGAVTLLGFEEEIKDGRRFATDRPKEYQVEYMGGAEPTLLVGRPYAYLFPSKYTKAIETLQRHGIQVEELREDIDLDVEIYKVTKIDHEPAFQKHKPVLVEATSRKESRHATAGTIIVRTGQPLGNLICYLLEPQSEDGLCTWNFFDEGLEVNKDYPVDRLPAESPLTIGSVCPLAQDRTFNKPLPLSAMSGTRGFQLFGGSPVTGLTWLPDGEHYLQVKAGRLYKVQSTTGRCEPFHDPEKLAKALGSLPTIGKSTAQSLARGTHFNMNPQQTGALFEHDQDLYYASFDGAKAVRLTKTPGGKQLASFSPDGQFIAFVRDNNLYVVDIATQTERALTTDGSSFVLNGKADWVYEEEIFNRTAKAYWWSPDSRSISFVRYDDTPVHKFTVVDHIPLRQVVEYEAYPKAGDPNPLVKLGIVSIAGDPVRWVDLSTYSDTSSLILRAGWTPDSRSVYFYVTDRAQTWLDFCEASPQGGAPKRLFRETTKAWVDDPGEAHFLKDGSFLFPSERTGWKHYYHFDSAGKLIRAVTSGDWEARALHHVDEQKGWVYCSGTRDSHIAENLYRIKLDGTGLERLTSQPGSHVVNLSPKGNWLIDTWSSYSTPTKVQLLKTDGSTCRFIDTNPVYNLEEYRLSKPELLQIKMPDGFEIQASILKPPDFDPAKKYPVWFMTYAGPHAPTIHDRWDGGHVNDHVFAQLGFIVFRCDPRSASGKGACSTWVAYRQLGVQELKDIEAAIRWLTSQPYVDASRVGMWGHSYGGFMTAYALTHSKLFAAGVAGAPVTDWHDYDSIYTERYMNTPQENPDGYDNTSVVKAARNLHGKLLILHGVMDDNVHMQNTLQLIGELQRADKDFEVMFYPQSRHGIFGKHVQRLIVDFMCRNLRPEKASPSHPRPTEPPRVESSSK
jgi:dipeptidyl aminopeptidase/acylaminoacyl peptidase